MTRQIIQKTFTEADQASFAALSGDYNPIHMDAVAARRTQAGARIVHGMHILLWCFDAVAGQGLELQNINELRASFKKMVYVGDTVEAQLARLDHTGFRIEARLEDVLVFQLVGVFGQPMPNPPPLLEQPSKPICPTEPIELKWENISGQSGRVGFATSAAKFLNLCPAAVRVLGQQRVAAIACTSSLVGMVCPGLHSVLAGVSINMCDRADEEAAISFRVASTDVRFKLVRLVFAGSGLFGTIDSFARIPPISQSSMGLLANLTPPSEFAGAKALIVGGSRGLGELAAKLIAAGGGQVTITYASGLLEAERVRDEILGWGGRCNIRPYDVRQPAQEQLKDMADIPTSLYYFATPSIFRRKLGFFSEALFAEFVDFYVSGFYRLCMALRLQQPRGFSAFYPSSVAVGGQRVDITEYAMAKAAGEVICADMNAQLDFHISVHRLPRLLTDQTATLIQAKTAVPSDIILPIIREVQLKAFHLTAEDRTASK